MFESLRLQHYRSYGDNSFEFSPGVNIIVGPNGSGKTNLLEALYILSRGTSFRSDDDSLIQHGKPWARIDAIVHGEDMTLKLLRAEPSPRKTLSRSKKNVKHLNLPVVLFEPDQLRIVHGPPELRRSWLDSLSSQIDPAYGEALKSYQRALRQRNRLLREGLEQRDDLFVWEIKLTEYGSLLVDKRRQLIDWLNDRLDADYSRLSGAPSKVGIAYATPFGESYGSQLLKALEERRVRDQARGFTSVGPHREDVAITFGTSAVEQVASRGERRTLYLCLKFLEAQRLEQQFEQKPALLLDDLFGELDDRRRRYLQGALRDNQIIITSTDDHPIADLGKKNIRPKRVIRL